MSVTLIVSLIGLGVVLLTNFAILIKDHVKVSELVEWQEEVDRHINNLERHIDPRRDGERHADLIKRMDRMEKKLDNLTLSEKTIISKLNKGDSEDA